VWPFTQSQPDELEALRTRVEALERDNHERQLAILSASEKVLNQLRARVRQREKDVDERAEEEALPTRPTSLAPLKRGMRGF